MPAAAEPWTAAASQGQDPLLAQYSFKKGEPSIGSGGFGEVYIGTRRKDGRNYALKYVDTRDAQWQQEYRLLTKMKHDNVLRAVEMFEPHRERRWTGVIVTELYDMDLSKFLLRRPGGLPQKVARGISRQIATGLGYVHKKGILHRDVKPQNIMMSLDTDEGGMRAVLADFGLARQEPRREEVQDFLAGLLGQGQMMTRQVMTPYYRAPEILLADTIKNKVRYTSAIDVWSLGCVMYELVTGKVLAQANSEQGVLNNIVRAIGPCPPPLSKVWGSRRVLAEQRSEEDAVATSQGQLLDQDMVASGRAAVWQCVTKTLRWIPSDRLACQQLLQDTWMQASGDGQDSAEAGAAEEDEAHGPEAATDRGDGSGGRGSSANSISSQGQATPRGDGLSGSGSAAIPNSSQVQAADEVHEHDCLKIIVHCKGQAKPGQARGDGSGGRGSSAIPASSQGQATPVILPASSQGQATPVLSSGSSAMSNPSQEAATDRADGSGGSRAAVILASSQGPEASPAILTSRRQSSPWRFGTQVACTTWRSSCACSCSGHCYVPGHRYHKGCKAVDLLIGSKYCLACACAVRGCGRPRHHGVYCSSHKKMVDGRTAGIRANSVRSTGSAMVDAMRRNRLRRIVSKDTPRQGFSDHGRALEGAAGDGKLRGESLEIAASVQC